MADQALTKRVIELQRAALSPATTKVYKAGTNQYSRFCHKYHITPFPTTELTLCYFAAHLSKEVQFPTVRVYLAAVRSKQLDMGWPDPLRGTQQLNRLLQGLSRDSVTRTRLPISPAILDKLLQTVLEDHSMKKHDRFLYASVISIAYFGCLRAGELCYPSSRHFSTEKHLTLNDLQIVDSTIELTIKQSKTDQQGKGFKVVIGQSNQMTCPVKLTTKFLQYRCHAQKTDALFRYRDGSLLTRPKLQKMLRNALSANKLPPEMFGTHSLRIGSATAAAEAGIPTDIIKAMGRWSSDCYRRYTRAPHKTLRNLTSQLCNM